MNKINEQLMQLINWLTWDLAKRIREQVLDEKKKRMEMGGGRGREEDQWWPTLWWGTLSPSKKA